MDYQSCQVIIFLALINDNTPVVDLSGPQVPSTNYSVSLTFSYSEGVGVAIAAENAAIFDADNDGQVASLSVSLEGGRSGDSLLLISSMCPDNGESLCR